MEPEPELQLHDIPEVAITESTKLPKAPSDKIDTPKPEKDGPSTKESTPVEIPLVAPDVAVAPGGAGAVEPLEADPVEAKIAEQLRTFRESPPVVAPPPGVSGSSPAIFQYHQGGMRKPINLEFQEFDDEDSWIFLNLRAADKGSKEKVSELAKIIQNKWGNKIQVNSIRQRKKGFVAHFYFLKYSHLEKRDVAALRKLQDVALKKGVCFLFVDEDFKNMHRVTKKLQDQSLLPPGVILLPWLQDFTDDQLKSIVGLAVSAKFEDMTKSMRTINRVLIPPLKK